MASMIEAEREVVNDVVRKLVSDGVSVLMVGY